MADIIFKFRTGGDNNAYTEADEIMRIRADGNVGIGTNDPRSKLDIEGNLAVGSTYSGSVAAPANGMIVEGNVGIGTNNPGSNLEVHGNIEVYDGNIDITGIGMLKMDGQVLIKNNGNNSTPDFYYNCRVIGNTTKDDGMWINFDSSGGSNADCRFYANGTNERMIIKASSGNVGIGTTTPQSKLDVEGNLAVGSTYSGSIAAPVNGMIVEGKLGIGNTTPQSKLDVEGSVRIGSSYAGNSNINTDPANGMIVEGNVGIGTDNPVSMLEVNGSIRGAYNTDTTSFLGRAAIGYTNLLNEASFAHINNYSQTNFALSQDPSGRTMINSAFDQPLMFKINNSEKMTLSSAGKLGIGNTTPQSKLDVDGSVRIGSSYAGDSNINTDPANGMIVEGNVGIGTNDPTSTARLRVFHGSTTENEKNITATDIFKDFVGINDTNSNTYAGRIYGTDSDITETGIRVCEKDGNYGLDSNYTKVLNVISNNSSTMVVTGAGNVGIGTVDPKTKLEIDSTDALRIPVGNTSQRPSDSLTGQIRYNTTTSQFEGYGASSDWWAIGGVINVARNTKIIASSPNDESTNNQLQFFTATTNSTDINDATERMRIDSIGNVGIGTDEPTCLLHISSATDAILKITGDSSNNAPYENTHPYLIFQQDGNVNEAGIFLGTRGTTEGVDDGENDLIISASFHGSNNTGGNIHFKTERPTGTDDDELYNLKYAPTRMTIAHNGKVGIGLVPNPTYNLLASPKETLHIKGGSILVEAVVYGSNEQAQPYLIVGSERHVEGNADTTNWGSFGFQHHFKTDSSANPRITVDTTQGEVYSMNHTGDITANSYNATSDMRHKENITDLDNSLEKIKAIRGVNFNFKNDDKIHSGIIAQEVAEIIPEAICKSNDEKWTANYNTFIGYLIESVKTLSKENDELKEDIKRKGDVIVKLHNDVSSIKEMLKIRN
jgi:hypothetical protein